MRLSLLRVFTLITPVHPCIKIKQDMWITWLKFAAKFSSKWLSFQPESTRGPCNAAPPHAVHLISGLCGRIVSGSKFNATTAQNQRTNTRFLALHRGGVDRFVASLVWGQVFVGGVTRGSGLVKQTD